MELSRILWVDLRLDRNQPSFYHYLTKTWTVYYTSQSEDAIHEIRKISPLLLCFEYDYPDTPGLLVLQQTIKLFPSTPIIMLTEQHSEELAVWALRNRVWDYLVKPFANKELLKSAEEYLSMPEVRSSGSHRQCNLATNPIPVDLRFHVRSKKTTLPAQYFVEKHYHEKIYEKQVAQLCGMSDSTFSRAFKKEYGTTFKKYLINYRICKARDMLKNPNAMVTNIAYTVGFHDPSYFTRTFRRIVGVSPSHYHEEHKIN